MKKLLIVNLLVISYLIPFNWIFTIIPASYAAEDWTTIVTTTEKVPWLECSSKWWSDVETRKYECTVKPWFQSFMDVLKWLIKYFLFIAILAVVFMLALSWVRMSIAGKNEVAKKQFMHLIEAILVIFLMGFILNSIAPWIYN